ncbi:uncharacterized protein LOC115455736 isoform X1 [Manduca sexta]|uniref:Uncharacterized protein n=1 Tax=Manduca sexta TaxID=7130 RepID=A0A922CF72_MANSE|nr:uncharacterized protein LOC115455736 isoform X1 [Manduca sexta]KAG6443193.1 hypothetical protein O3G_MSEX002702 [Manduca sexta]
MYLCECTWSLCCCTCSGASSGVKSSLPLICLVPRDDARLPDQAAAGKPRPASAGTVAQSDFQLLDEEYIKKHFKLPQRSLYLDPFRRPLITFPMTQEDSKHFNLARKYKTNQQILDGYLDPSEAISAPSVFPYAKSESEKRKENEDDEEIIYILQLPDWEFKCPVHNQTIRTPRFIWHSCKKPKKEKGGEPKRGGGPLNKPKPWLLSRHTDFDLLSQW